ncbi:SAM-dependent methyltransferase, MidA family [Devosia enhydra]|uniref:SAM-dependent methyltransferase, MidA family n=1 Tax=Devosia enhydra TaxID=665118 RepID=A0A1K2HWM4_9HYPH|nr:SAM-dependent methyltransferase [Devosia enhydra]SFZ83098.1 SAM-dependent methyltransferase, MidA family [Devosia enhydra]
MSETDLSDRIKLEIETGGPMSVARYMALCLSHPRQGYYRAGDPLGAAGDFITAPEISQMFGELVGLFIATLWQQMGSPRRFDLLELGPGRGTLMQDALRVASRVPGLAGSLRLSLFESSPGLRAEQAARLAPFAPVWSEDIVPDGDAPLIVIANEFFDALPIRQFVKGGEGWHEREIGLADDALAFGLSPTPLPSGSLPPQLAGAEAGEVFELGLAARQVTQRLAEAVRVRGGAVLAIDYGYEGPRTGETLQGVRRHAFADPLSAPGLVDLSAHVDFGALAEIGRKAGLAVAPITAQGIFLTRLGIGERAAALAKANHSEAESLARALERLVAPDEMGTLFKAFCMHSPGLQPPGFAP